MTGPEKRELRVGFTPLTDAAPIIAAQELGWFARYGLRVSLSREPSWSNIRDKLAAGVLDAAHALAPMPLAATLGVGPIQQPTLTALSLGLGGNAVSVSTELRRALDALDPDAGADPLACGRALVRLARARRERGAAPLRIGTVFPVSMHTYELRHWLSACGAVLDCDVALRVVPPPRMAAELEAGKIDGFCVGEPWSSVALQRGSGEILLAAHDLWSHAPEKVLAVSVEWARRHPGTHRALLCALLESARWCDEPDNRGQLARWLAGERYVAAPEAAIRAALEGRIGGRELPDFFAFSRFAASFPWRSHAAWIAAQMLRLGQLEKPVDVRAAAAAVYRTDLHREAARELGLPVPLDDEKLEGAHASAWSLPGSAGPIAMPADRFFDGRGFDPKDVAGYLAGFPSSELALPLDEIAAAQRTGL